MVIKRVEIKRGKELTAEELIYLAKWTQKIFYGGGDFDKELRRLVKEKNSIFFLLKDGEKILAFSFLKPTRIKYLNNTYNILGIRNTITIKQNKGYGSLLMKDIIKFLEDNGKTGLGFTGSRVAKFYKKVGFSSKRGLRKRLFPEYGNKKDEIFNWGFYIEGKDKFISNILKDKLIVLMPTKKW